MEAIRKYCAMEHFCFSCFQEDQQDPVKLSLGLCHICDKEKWNKIRSSISTDDLIRHSQVASKEWVFLYKEELKLRM